MIVGVVTGRVRRERPRRPVLEALIDREDVYKRQLIDTRALVYFLSVTIVCLLVSFRSLESRKWS